MFLEYFVGVTKEQFSQPNFEVLQMLDYPEMHTESLSFISFFKVLNEFMYEAGIKDFSLKDILQPEPKRFKMILSYIINFAKFREEHAVIYEEITERANQLSKERDELSAVTRDLKAKVDGIKLQREQEEPAVLNAEKKNQALVEKMVQLRNEQGVLSEKYTKAKAEKVRLSDKLHENQENLMSLKQEINRLRGRIVSSPEKLMQAIQDFHDKIAEEKNSLNLNEKKSRELQIKLEGLNSLQVQLDSCLNVFGNCENILNRENESKTKLNDLKDAIYKQQQILREFDVKKQQMERMLNNAEEKLNRLRIQQESKKENIQSKLKSLQEEYNQIKLENQKVKNKINHYNNEIESHNNKIQLLKKNHEQEILVVQRKFENMKDDIKQFMSEINPLIN
ncbi:Kinetochore protein Nuf2 domain-containing protein [Rozella allomycis CSF55]|uniref:Kinetochore protein Nuf2 domain-containing protein n=1 Tax=Rozella allomycis (strain CSF55) TaxID=988480 RepID=A0A075AZG2_ROZAC|nr:Kinetochore protein Nuf2 domain-containing protein [Rozella allomycis CSF55]|eukprot:EPZ35539.1 Kinetochore protein Nuf2 domain-containing protein [Rozella allomycis CSF55]